ncbi:hypothetical protein [Streptomyces variegatus]|uniref:hypothetical protein n=1 Tax=Streptomyces variegatus TaxID=284040 RepID=UPI003C30E133
MSPRHIAHATHAAPPPGFTITPCCGTTPTDLPRFHGVTPDLRAVTCQGHPVSPVRELVAIVLTGTQRLGTRARRFLPHGGEDGHVYDERCALCAGDVRQLADHTTEALVAAFPDADVRNLRGTRPRTPGPRAPGPYRGPLRSLVEVVLTTTPSTGVWSDGGFRPHGSPDGHQYDRRCALCTADVDPLASAVETALSRALPSVVAGSCRPRRLRRPADALVSQGAP